MWTSRSPYGEVAVSRVLKMPHRETQSAAWRNEREQITVSEDPDCDGGAGADDDGAQQARSDESTDVTDLSQTRHAHVREESTDHESFCGVTQSESGRDQQRAIRRRFLNRSLIIGSGGVVRWRSPAARRRRR